MKIGQELCLNPLVLKQITCFFVIDMSDNESYFLNINSYSGCNKVFCITQFDKCFK